MSETITLTDAEVGTMEGFATSGPTPVHSQHMDDTETLVFNNCKKGLGVKIIGGKSEDNGMDYGIFVKRILNGGLAAKGGQLFEGDQILTVNGESLLSVTNERAVLILRSASATNHVTLVITRNPSAKEDFSTLCESQPVYSRTASSSSMSDTRSVSSLGSSANYASVSPRSLASSSSMTSSRITAHQRIENVQQITIPKIAGLGLSIAGGVEHADGPIIYVDHVIVGGDSHKDGRLRVGDQLVAIDGHSLIGLKQEDVKALMTRIKLRTDKPSTTVAFIRSSLQNTSSQSPMPSSHPTNPSSNHTPSSRLDTPHSNHQSNRSSPHSRHGYNSSPVYPYPSELIAQLQVAQVNHTTPSPHLTSRLPAHSNPSASMTSPQQQLRNSPVHQVASPGTNAQGYQLGSANGPTHYSNGGVRHQTPMPALPYHMQGLHSQPKMSSTPQTDQSNLTSPGVLLQLPHLPASTSDPSPVGHHGQHHRLGTSTLSSQQISQSTSGLGSSSSRMSRDRRLSLDPQVRLRIDKLEVALQYLGLHPDEAQKAELRRRLTIDGNGMVPYGDFVRTARKVLQFQLDDHGLSAGSLMFAAHDVTDFAEPPPFNPQISHIVSPVYSNVEQVKQERDEALLEVERLKGLLTEKESTFNIAEEELLRIRREAQGAIHESRALKSRVHLAEAAQKEARNMEIDYEEVVGLLEKEVADLRKAMNQTKTSSASAMNAVDSNSGNLQRKLAVLTCELRKCQVGKKVYEVSTDKLLRFAELVHETLMDGPNGPGARSRGEAPRRGESSYYPPGYLAQHARNGPVNLASEARDTVKAVKALMESEPLPYGWEEAYTADGMKYYLNHQTQMSTWSHPVSNIAQLQQGDVLEPDELLQESRT